MDVAIVLAVAAAWFGFLLVRRQREQQEPSHPPIPQTMTTVRPVNPCADPDSVRCLLHSLDPVNDQALIKSIVEAWSLSRLPEDVRDLLLAKQPVKE